MLHSPQIPHLTTSSKATRPAKKNEDTAMDMKLNGTPVNKHHATSAGLWSYIMIGHSEFKGRG